MHADDFLGFQGLPGEGANEHFHSQAMKLSSCAYKTGNVSFPGTQHDDWCIGPEHFHTWESACLVS